MQFNRDGGLDHPPSGPEFLLRHLSALIPGRPGQKQVKRMKIYYKSFSDFVDDVTDLWASILYLKWENANSIEAVFKKIQRLREDSQKLLKTTRSLKYDGYIDVCVQLSTFESIFEKTLITWNNHKGQHKPDQFKPFLLALYNAIPAPGQNNILAKQRDRIEQIAEAVDIQEDSKKLPKLSITEKEIIKALGDKRLIGEYLAKMANHPYQANFKNALSTLVKRGILDNKRGEGYFLRKEYHYILLLLVQNQSHDEGQD